MKTSKFVSDLFLAAVLAVAGAAPALAQAPPAGTEVTPGPPANKMYGPLGPGGGGPFEFRHFEMGLGGKTVTGAPYSAQVVTQISQTLADGTHIQRQSTGSVSRDTAGRVRREMTMPALGALTGSAQVPTAVFINDPVAGYHYVLHADSKTADRMPMPPHGGAGFGPGKGAAAGPNAPGGAAVPGGHRHDGSAQVSKVSLGTQTIEGVQAEGTRLTKTIPAGQVGNDRAIQIVTERWYSPDLQTVVLMKHSDPWSGETTYRLANINRSEPAATLFQVPADYSVTDRTPPHGFRGRRGPHGPAGPGPSGPPPPPPGDTDDE